MRHARSAIRSLGVILASGLLLAGAAGADPAAIDRAAEPVRVSFDRFCGSWMQKLAAQEKRNAEQVRLVKNGKGVTGDYVGYERKPLRCVIKSTGVAQSPYVGKLTYREIRYRKAGKDAKRARSAKPKAFHRLEVTEIFRWDGKRWVY
jgi:hypothetical protein